MAIPPFLTRSHPCALVGTRRADVGATQLDKEKKDVESDPGIGNQRQVLRPLLSSPIGNITLLLLLL